VRRPETLCLFLPHRPRNDAETAAGRVAGAAARAFRRPCWWRSPGDLPDLDLGSTVGKAITIDATAAGWGWTVAGGQMDLLTAVLHELGHVLGLDHGDVAGGLMGGTLAPGSVLRLVGSPLARAVSAPFAVRAPLRTTISGGGFQLGPLWLLAPRAVAIRRSATSSVLRTLIRPALHGRTGHTRSRSGGSRRA